MRGTFFRPRSASVVCKARLQVEVLEGRELLSASPWLDPPAEPARILVGWRESPGQPTRVDLGPGESLDAALARLRSDPRVSYAEPDYEVRLRIIPNDPQFGSLYGLHNTGQNYGKVDADIDAPEAWDITTGSSRTIVAVIDTGIDYRHGDLYRNIWVNQGEIPVEIKARLTDIDSDGLITFWDLNDSRNQGVGKITDQNGNGRIDAGDILKPYKSDGTGGWANGGSDDGDGFVDDLVGWDFVNSDNDPFDDNGHGTHVSGTIGATGNDGVGVAGVNWRVQIMALKFLGASGTGNTSNAVDALNYAVAHGAKISNNSWGGSGYSQALFDAIASARSRGHIFVAAAGNDGVDIDVRPDYPASYAVDNVVSVAATTRTDGRASFSNYGASTVDLGAPGLNVLSTVPNDRYATYSGTSMAAPHVTGALALLQSYHPDWTYRQLIDHILNTGDPIPSLAGKTVTGARLNAGRALASPLGTDSVGPRVLSVRPDASGANPVSSVRVTFSESIDPATFTTDDVTSFRGPKGVLTVQSIQAVSGSNNQQFDITFAAQSTPGTYSLTIGPDIRDRSGNRMNQDGDGILGESVDAFKASFAINPVYSYSASGPIAIRDNSSIQSSVTVDRDATIVDINVTINLDHTYDADLYIHLRGPDGQDIPLVNRRGGSGDNFRNTTFDDESTVAISAGKAPFTGRFRPEMALSTFDGKNARGTWTLIIEDRASRDTGTFYSWTLAIESDVASLSGRSIEVMEETAAESGPRREVSAPLSRLSLVERAATLAVLPLSVFESPSRSAVEPSRQTPRAIERSADTPILQGVMPARTTPTGARRAVALWRLTGEEVISEEELVDFFLASEGEGS